MFQVTYLGVFFPYSQTSKVPKINLLEKEIPGETSGSLVSLLGHLLNHQELGTPRRGDKVVVVLGPF